MTANIINCKNIKRVFKIKRRKPNWTFQSWLNPKFQSFIALNDISFTLKKGQILGLIGENGAGKTTLLKIIVGLLNPTEGNIQVLQQNPFLKKNEFLSKIGMVLGQKSQLWPDISAYQSFELLAKIYKIPQVEFKKQISYLDKSFQVSDFIYKQVRKLSLGQRMRLEIMASLIHKPELLLLDEPTIGLDIESKNNIRLLIKKLNKELNTTIILTSHDMHDIENICQKLIILQNGKIIFDDKIEQLEKIISDGQTRKISINTENHTYFKNILNSHSINL